MPAVLSCLTSKTLSSTRTYNLLTPSDFPNDAKKMTSDSSTKKGGRASCTSVLVRLGQKAEAATAGDILVRFVSFGVVVLRGGRAVRPRRQRGHQG